MADAPTSPGGGSHESGGDQSPRSVREQDRFLPIANISRIMKKGLPSNGKIAKDAKETVQECVSEFISFITSEYDSIIKPFSICFPTYIQNLNISLSVSLHIFKNISLYYLLVCMWILFITNLFLCLCYICFSLVNIYLHIYFSLICVYFW